MAEQSLIEQIDLFDDQESPSNREVTVDPRPDGVYVVPDGERFWLERVRAGRSSCAVLYTREELILVTEAIVATLR